MTSWPVGWLQMVLACNLLSSLPETGRLMLVQWLPGPRPLALAVLQCTERPCEHAVRYLDMISPQHRLFTARLHACKAFHAHQVGHHTC